MRRIGVVVVGGEGYDFSTIAEKFPFAANSVLFQIGMRAARQIYRQELAGILRPRGFSRTGAPISPSGKRMVSFSITRDNKHVIVRSFPMNVYRAEGERGPRTMKRTAGKKIFRSFEGGFNTAGVAETALENVLRNSKLFQPENNEGWNTRLKKLGGSREGVL
jgi:hypothetical protein